MIFDHDHDSTHSVKYRDHERENKAKRTYIISESAATGPSMAVELAVGAGMRPPGGQVEDEEEEEEESVGSGVASLRRASAKQYFVMLLIK